MAITVQGPTGVFQPSYPDIIDKYGVVTKMFTSSFKEYFTSSGAVSYSINKSLRFRSSASAYLNRTPTTTTNRTTWTWSAWVKRGTLGVQNPLFFAGTAAVDYALVLFTTGDVLAIGLNTSGSSLGYIYSPAVYRDTAAWYHIVAILNTTSATTTVTGTTTDRMQLWVNGVQVVPTSANLVPAQNAISFINSNVAHYHALYPDASPTRFDGEMAEINFVDGQALAPTSFGTFNSYNQWQPITYGGSYGTNGFYLPFTNTASTSTLVADSSGNGNNWTPNNISLTAGSTYDSLTDVPTLTSTTVANYAVLNPLVPPELSTTFNDGNLRFVGAGAVVGSMGMSAKTYVEMTPASATDVAIGVGPLVSGSRGGAGQGIQDSVLWFSSGSVFKDGGATAVATYATFTTNDVCAFTFDPSNRQVTFYKNNVSQGSQTVSGTQAISFYTLGNTGATAAVNFGQRPFAYTPPANFLALNTFNI